MHEMLLQVTGRLVVRTDASVWFVEADRYVRFPRFEAPRGKPRSIDDALADSVWHAHRGVWFVEDELGPRLRILPAWRPVGSSGIATGVIVTAVSRATPAPSTTAPGDTVLGASLDEAEPDGVLAHGSRLAIGDTAGGLDVEDPDELGPDEAKGTRMLS